LNTERLCNILKLKEIGTGKGAVNMSNMGRKKITVIGAGNVGAETANMLVSRELGDVVLIDMLGDMAKGKALDILTSAALKGSASRIVGSDDYSLIANSDVVVITAGLARKPGMTREDLVGMNGKIIADITKNVAKYAPDAIIIMVTNPLDVMTALALKVSGFAPEKVFGMAGVLDTARFKTFIAEELNVAPQDITAMVLGGHGDDMLPLIDNATVSGVPLRQLMDEETLARLVERTKNGGAEIVSLLKTGSAYYAPAVSAVEMVEAVIKDKKSIMPVSALLTGEYGIKDIYLGVPAVIGAGGMEKVIEFQLSQSDLEKLQASAKVVKETIDKLENLMSAVK
jgi:malate dehydrogenase